MWALGFRCPLFAWNLRGRPKPGAVEAFDTGSLSRFNAWLPLSTEWSHHWTSATSCPITRMSCTFPGWRHIPCINQALPLHIWDLHQGQNIQVHLTESQEDAPVLPRGKRTSFLCKIVWNNKYYLVFCGMTYARDVNGCQDSSNFLQLCIVGR